MIFLQICGLLALQRSALACPNPPTVPTATKQITYSIGNFDNLISRDSKLQSIISNIDALMTEKNRSFKNNSVKKDDKEENLVKPDGMKTLKSLLQIAKKHGEKVPEIGKYIKMVATVVDFIISDGTEEQNSGAIGKLEETIKQTKMEIMSELKDVKAVCAENEFDQISMHAGTLLSLLNDTLFAIAERRSNENWWRPVMKFLEECNVNKPFILVKNIGQLPHERLPVNTRMEADFLKQNRTLEMARLRIATVLNILTLVRTFELVLSKDDKTVDFEVNEMFKNTDKVLEKVETEMSTHITTDSFKIRMPDLVEYSLKDTDHLNVQGKAERLMMALNASATLDRFIVIVYEHKKGPANIILNGPSRPCRISQMIDAVEENVYIDKNSDGCCGIVIYRSKNLRIMKPEERQAFRDQHFTRREGIECLSKKASDIRKPEAGFAIQTVCLNLAMIVDTRDLIEPTHGYHCYARNHELAPPHNKYEIAHFQYDYAYPL